MPPYSYVWSNGTTMASISNLPAGSYGVTVTDNNGESVSETASVGEPTDWIVIMDADFDQLTMWATPTGGTPPYQFLWNTGATSDTISNIVSDTLYFVTVTDANGCTAEEHFYIISSTNELGIEMRWQVMPNPFKNSLIVSLDLKEAKPTAIQLMDAQGRQVMDLLPFGQLTSGKKTVQVSTAALPPGVYFVVVNVNGKMAARKVVKL
jgi:hypothetical protein